MTSTPPSAASEQGGGGGQPGTPGDGATASGSSTGADSGVEAGAESGAAAPRRGKLRKLAVDTRPLRHPAYRRLWTSSIVTAMGSQMTAVAVPFQVYQLTNSSGWVGIASFCGLLPLIVFGLWGGAIADTMDRRKLMLLTNTGVAVSSIALWVQAALHVDSIALLIGLLMVQQAMFGMNSPARSATIPRLVPREELPAANALSGIVMSVGGLVGPMVGGALIPITGLSTLYLLDACGLTVTLWAVLRLPLLPPLGSAPKRAGVGHIVEGFRVGLSNRLLAWSFGVDLIAMIFGMPRALFPQMADTTFAGNHLALSWLYAAIPLGSVLGGLLSGSFSRLHRHGLMTIVAVGAWGAAIIGFGLSGNIALAGLFLALGGAADLMSMVFRQSILQTVVTDELKGRMQGVFTVVVAGGPRLADLAHGLAGAALGTRTAVTAGGVLVVVGMIAVAVLVPQYRDYRAEI
ncbi:MFS transporter [Actinospica durhamensis]|uniref:MFS transporter n=1 Tax=Actinospica durhamensis TaxID=1508375 RepID=UPI003F6877AA